jgi:hypothetical protein
MSEVLLLMEVFYILGGTSRRNSVLRRREENFKFSNGYCAPCTGEGGINSTC